MKELERENDWLEERGNEMTEEQRKDRGVTTEEQAPEKRGADFFLFYDAILYYNFSTYLTYNTVKNKLVPIKFLVLIKKKPVLTY